MALALPPENLAPPYLFVSDYMPAQEDQFKREFTEEFREKWDCALQEALDDGIAAPDPVVFLAALWIVMFRLFPAVLAKAKARTEWDSQYYIEILQDGRASLLLLPKKAHGRKEWIISADGKFVKEIQISADLKVTSQVYPLS